VSIGNESNFRGRILLGRAVPAFSVSSSSYGCPDICRFERGFVSVDVMILSGGMVGVSSWSIRVGNWSISLMGSAVMAMRAVTTAVESGSGGRGNKECNSEHFLRIYN